MKVSKTDDLSFPIEINFHNGTPTQTLTKSAAVELYEKLRKILDVKTRCSTVGCGKDADFAFCKECLFSMK